MENNTDIKKKDNTVFSLKPPHIQKGKSDKSNKKSKGKGGKKK